MAEVDGERKPQRQPRAHQPRRLRDISHLYLSSRAAPAPRGPVAPRRRCLRVGFIGSGRGSGKAAVCANMAVQLVRLGQRTLVLELDAQLPNVGFLLGLCPQAYLTHLFDSAPRLERALLGLRVLEGAGTDPHRELPEAYRQELEASECILVNLPEDIGSIDAWLGTLKTLWTHRRPTTMVEAASRSPMFGTWLESARRQDADEAPIAVPQPHGLDALLYVHDRDETDHVQPFLSRLSQWVPSNRVRFLAWGNGRLPAGLHPWAWIRAEGGVQQEVALLSSLFPEHPTSRTYQGLVQSLLAGAPGGLHA